MVAQLLAPVVMLPLILVVRCLTFLFKELFYKLLYDDLGDGSWNGVLPPLELFVSIVELGRRIMTMLLRPVQVGTRSIVYALKRIQQELSVIIRQVLKPVVMTPHLFNERNFLIRLLELAPDGFAKKGAIDAIVNALDRKARRRPLVSAWG